MADDAARRPSLPADPDPASPAPSFGHDEPRAPDERELSRGLRFLHVWNSRTREDAWKSMLGMQTLMELLVAKGVVTVEELEQQSQVTGPRVHEAFEADPLAPCRSFDCRSDERIWLDFEARIPADYAAIDAKQRATRAARRAALEAARASAEA